MRLILAAITGVTCALFCLGAGAQSWAKEPTTVLGVRLGAPISESSAPRCNEVASNSQETCLDKSGGLADAPARFTIRRPPFGYADFTAIVDDSGLVSQVIAILNQSRFSEFANILIERYGAPSSTADVQWQNRAGAKFSSRELTWIGRRTQILAMERGHTVDRSIVVFQDIAAIDREAQKSKEKIKDAASKL